MVNWLICWLDAGAIIAYAELWAVPFLEHADHLAKQSAADVNSWIFIGIFLVVLFLVFSLSVVTGCARLYSWVILVCL